MFTGNFPDHLPNGFWFGGGIQSADIFLPGFFFCCHYHPVSFSPIQLILYQIGSSGLFLKPFHSSSLQSDHFSTFIVEPGQKKGSSKVFGGFALSGLLGSGRVSMLPVGTLSLRFWVIAVDPAFITGH